MAYLSEKMARTPIVFKEVQRPIKSWLGLLLLLFLTLLLAVAIYKGIETSEPLTLAQFLPILFSGLLILLLLTFKMTTVLSMDHCHIQITIIGSYTFPLDATSEIDATAVNPKRWMSFGKYTRDGIFYTIGNKYGLAIKHNKITTVIGTHKLEELRSSIALIKNKHGINHG